MDLQGDLQAGGRQHPSGEREGRQGIMEWTRGRNLGTENQEYDKLAIYALLIHLE